MTYEYDTNEIKNNISDDEMFELLLELGAEPQWQNGYIINKTICHCGNSHKLYYYPNSRLFHCYTDCSDSWDIFELVLRVKNREEDAGWELPQAIDYIARKFGYSAQSTQEAFKMDNLQDWKVIQKYDRIKDINIETQEIELQEYDDIYLSHLPQPVINPWIQEGMTQDELIRHNIRYDPKNAGIVIPHYDINNRLIGIRERTMVEENEKYGKYRPAYIHGKLYNHPLSYNLYNINNSKDNIRKFKKAFVFESEKSCILYSSYFKKENDISVAICGSSFLNYQAWLLIQLGVDEIIIALDKQFQTNTDNEFKKLIKNLKNIHYKYGNYTKISFLFDKTNLLNYKDSPIDQTPEIFLELYKNRVNLY